MPITELPEKPTENSSKKANNNTTECRGIDPADYDEPPENPKQYEHEEKLEKAMDRFFGNKP